ncbi:DNA-3-methyladenine glycosylase [Curtobacterium sp. RRHDQ10]|uniref:DNA-3-methyladenine glycosylase n=1 Tax=Curtobacterium phyllosphaerae TaxID=3413379 RepID=UPI003BF29B38
MNLSLLDLPALAVAPALLGATISGRGVTIRITEVEAYMGETDPGSHAFRGVRTRNRHLFGPPGTLYAYRSYGIHTCCNIVSGPDGVASGSLLRAGEVVDGLDVARERRGDRVTDVGLARGPGNLGQALGALLDDDGSSTVDGTGPYTVRLSPVDGLEARLAAAQDLPSGISTGPRTGIRGLAGGAGFPWRFWLAGDPTVSAYRRHPQALDGPPDPAPAGH